MAIVKMNKFTLLTFEMFKEQLLKQLQIFEGVHFKDLQDSDFTELELLKNDFPKETAAQYEGEIVRIKFARDKISPYVQKPSGLKALTTFPDTLGYEAFNSFTETYDYSQTYEALKVLDDKQKAFKAERNRLKADNENLAVWLNLDAPIKELEALKQVSCLAGMISKTPPEQFTVTMTERFPAGYFEVVSTIKDETAVLCVVGADEAEEAFTTLKNIGFSKTNVNLSRVPSEQVALNNKRLAELDELDKDLCDQVASFAGEDKQLGIALDYYKTVLERARVCENFLATDKVVIIDGWVAQEDTPKLQEILTECCGAEFYIELNEVEKESTEVPIRLKNNKVVSAFESVTAMYSLPRYSEIDPTPMHTPFYMLFFGFMVGDTGFGLVLLLISFLGMKVFNISKGAKKFMAFLFYLSFFVIFAGFIYGSFFGWSFFNIVPTTLRESGFKPILDVELDIQNMIIYSMVIGIIQVLFGVAVKGWLLLRDGKPLDALFDSAFWFLCVLGGIGFLVGAAAPALVPAALTTVCKWTFFAMLVGLILTQGRENKNIGTKLAGGLFGAYGLSSYVGDIVSYTRIMALGLSGAYIAMSFHRMAGLIPAPLGYVFGTLILVFGLTLDLGLGVLGAYVHTCRLQYVEFFGKFYEGGGKPFKPFGLVNESVEIKH